jgi:hypothetical protein
MRPKLLDAAGVLSGRKVSAGELLGQIGNFSQHENGTSYHVHFDVQVPTRAGWVFVSPYMTLVAAYERLIGGRGTETAEDVVASAPAGMSEGDSFAPLTLAAIRQAIFAPAERPVPIMETRPRVRIAGGGACGMRIGHQRLWRGCFAAAAAHPAPGGQARHGFFSGVHGAVTVRRGGYAARAAVLTHRVYRRHRT